MSVGAGAPRLAKGVNVVGYLDAEDGVGEVARLLVETLRRAAIPHSVVVNRQTPSRQSSSFRSAQAGTPYDTNIVCVNADQLEVFAAGVGQSFFDARYTVGIWAWEVEVFPQWMREASRFVDEIWVYSAHTTRALERAVAKPLFTFPPPVVPPDAPSLGRRELGLPDGFLFLFCFDFHSVFERKNPLGLVDAFRRAFPQESGTVLVLKMVNSGANPAAMQALRSRIGDRADIVVLDGYLSRHRYFALLDACDAYASLHRAEGFGLTMAEAMALGKPVIATAYSGNLEFMNAENSYLVPYAFSAIGPGCDPYPPGARWAEPDTDAAADLMRQVAGHPERAAAKGNAARAQILSEHGFDARARLLRERLEDVEGRRRATLASRAARHRGSRPGFFASVRDRMMMRMRRVAR